MSRKLVFAVDFDGTLVENNYPQVGAPKMEVINKVKELQSLGHEVVLWTCRENSDLIPALEFFDKMDLHFSYINSNPKYRIEQFDGKDCRKIGADYYIDDKALSIDDFINLKVERNEEDMEYTFQVVFNPDWSQEEIKAFKEKVKNNGNYCPCALIKEKDTRCMCKEFRDQNYEGLCHCGLYYKKKIAKISKK